MRVLWLATMLLAAVGCSTKTEVPANAASAPGVAKHAAPSDETRRFPVNNRVSTSLVADHALDRVWLPGGTLGHYKKGGKEWDLLLLKADSAATAAVWLLDYKKELEGAKLVPSFGGFYGTDKGRPAFVFSKREWFAAVLGLPEAEADAAARPFALRIN